MIVVMVRMPVGSNEDAERIIARFKNRAGMVDNQPGFMGFELLKAEGECVSMTRWASKEALDTWMKGQAHSQAHGGGPPPITAGHWQSEAGAPQHTHHQSSQGGSMQGNVTIYEVALPAERQA